MDCLIAWQRDSVGMRSAGLYESVSDANKVLGIAERLSLGLRRIRAWQPDRLGPMARSRPSERL